MRKPPTAALFQPPAMSSAKPVKPVPPVKPVRPVKTVQAVKPVQNVKAVQPVPPLQAAPKARQPEVQPKRVTLGVQTPRGEVRTSSHNPANQMPTRAKRRSRGKA